LKMVKPTREMAIQHYQELKSQPFFETLVNNMCNGAPIVCMVWQGKGVNELANTVVGTTYPTKPSTEKEPLERASREIALWFTEEEIHEWDTAE